MKIASTDRLTDFDHKCIMIARELPRQGYLCAYSRLTRSVALSQARDVFGEAKTRRKDL